MEDFAETWRSKAREAGAAENAAGAGQASRDDADEEEEADGEEDADKDMDDDDLDDYLRTMVESRAAASLPSPPLFVDSTGLSGVAAAIAADSAAGGGGAGNDDNNGGRRGRCRRLALQGGRHQSRPP